MSTYLIRITSISVIETGRNFQKFFKLFFLFDAMVSGTSMGEEEFSSTSEEAEILRHLIAHTIGDTSAAVRQYDVYICDCFMAFTQNKLDIELGGLRSAPSHLAELIGAFRRARGRVRGEKRPHDQHPKADAAAPVSQSEANRHQLWI